MPKRNPINRTIFGGLCFSVLGPLAGADELHFNGGMLFGRAVEVSSENVAFDVGCSGEFVIGDWDELYLLKFSDDCHAYKGWLGGGTACEDEDDILDHIPRPGTWEVWIKRTRAGGDYEMAFHVDSIVGYGLDAISFVEIGSGEVFSFPTENMFIAKSDNYCPFWVDLQAVSDWLAKLS